MNTHEIRARLVNALTTYDRKQSTRRRYNPHALAIYLNRIDDIMADIEAGTDARRAICTGFSDRVLDVALKALDLDKANREETQGLWEYKPIAKP